MVEKIEAFRCEKTSAIFRDRERAVASEFHAMMKSAGAKLGYVGSVNPIDMMDWVADQVRGNVYPQFFPMLLEALEYWRDNAPSKD